MRVYHEGLSTYHTGSQQTGQLASITSVLAREKINIRSITISSFGPQGFLNILVDDPKGAQKALIKEGHNVDMKQVVAVLIEDRPGGLDGMVQLLFKENVNIENAYGFVLESRKHAVFVIEVDQIDTAIKILEEHKYKTLSAEALDAIEPFHYMKY